MLSDAMLSDVMVRGRPHVAFELGSPAAEVLRAAAQASWQDVFPVLGPDRQMAGMVDAHVLYALAAEREIEPLTVAADLMVPPLWVLESEGLQVATQRLLDHTLRELPVLDGAGRIVGFIEDSDVTRAYLGAIAGVKPPGSRS